MIDEHRFLEENRVSTSANTIETFANQEYKWGFVTEIDADTVPPGLNEDVIRLISKKKNEPEFMLEWRLKAYRHWLTMQEQQRIIAVVCSPPPEGRARWTVRLLTEEVIKRKLVPRVGRETIRILLESHDLKPWREKNVVRGEVGRGVYRQDGGRAQDIRKASL